MPNVTKYEVSTNGGPTPYQNQRAQISLSDGTTHIGYIRFVDAGVTIPADTMVSNIIYMYQSISMFQNIIGILRQETAATFYFGSGHAFLVAESN